MYNRENKQTVEQQAHEQAAEQSRNQNTLREVQSSAAPFSRYSAPNAMPSRADTGLLPPGPPMPSSLYAGHTLGHPFTTQYEYGPYAPVPPFPDARGVAPIRSGNGWHYPGTGHFIPDALAAPVAAPPFPHPLVARPSRQSRAVPIINPQAPFVNPQIQLPTESSPAEPSPYERELNPGAPAYDPSASQKPEPTIGNSRTRSLPAYKSLERCLPVPLDTIEVPRGWKLVQDPDCTGNSTLTDAEAAQALAAAQAGLAEPPVLVEPPRKGGLFDTGHAGIYRAPPLRTKSSPLPTELRNPRGARNLPASKDPARRRNPHDVVNRLMQPPRDMRTPDMREYRINSRWAHMNGVGPGRMVWNKTLGRDVLREDDELRTEGLHLGLPPNYLKWLCAEEGFTSEIFKAPTEMFQKLETGGAPWGLPPEEREKRERERERTRRWHPAPAHATYAFGVAEERPLPGVGGAAGEEQWEEEEEEWDGDRDFLG